VEVHFDNVSTASHQSMAAQVASITRSSTDLRIITPIHVHYVAGFGGVSL